MVISEAEAIAARVRAAVEVHMVDGVSYSDGDVVAFVPIQPVLDALEND